jgi:hypothetical protein
MIRHCLSERRAQFAPMGTKGHVPRRRVFAWGACLAVFCFLGCAPGTEPTPGGNGGSEEEGQPITEDHTVTTEDGKVLSATLSNMGHLTSDGVGGILLIHQFQRDKSQWGNWPANLARGSIVLALDLRGHGESDPYDGPLTNLLTDPLGAPLDLEAGLRELVDQGADPNRLAVVGTSVGANLAVVASIKGYANTVAAISPRIEPIEALAEQNATGMEGAFYLAGQNDPGGQADDAQALFDATGEKRALTIVAGSADHGIDLFNNAENAKAEIQTWLNENL